MPLGLKDSLLIVIDVMIQWIMNGLHIDSNSRKGGKYDCPNYHEPQEWQEKT